MGGIIISEKKKILLVDDDPDFIELIQLSLAGEFEVSTAMDGFEGIQKAAEILPDLILMDVIMPNVSGIEMVRMLTTEEDTKNIPVIVLTGTHTGKGIPELFKQESNVKQFLSKMTPVIDIETLIKEILYSG